MKEIIGKSEKDVSAAERIRTELLINIPIVLDSPTIPSLSEEEKVSVFDKLVHLADTD